MKKIKKIVRQSKETKRISELENKIKSLEARIFKPKEEKKIIKAGDSVWSMPWVFDIHWEPQPLEWELEDLQDKLDAVIEYLKIDVSKTQAKESEYVAKLIKKSK